MATVWVARGEALMAGPPASAVGVFQVMPVSPQVMSATE